jgi:hypothetical protein
VKRANLWAILGVALLVALVGAAVGWFLMTFERVRDEVHVGASGMARVNPYWAAELFLTEVGVPAESRHGVGVLPTVDRTLLVVTSDREARRAIAPAIVRWVSGGGHLIVSAVRPDPDADPAADPTDEGQRDPLLDAFALRLERSTGFDGAPLAPGVPPLGAPPAPGVPPLGTPRAPDAPDAPDAGPGADDVPPEVGGLMRALGLHSIRREARLVALPGAARPLTVEIDTVWSLAGGGAVSTDLSTGFDPTYGAFRPVLQVPHGRGVVTAIVDSWFLTNTAIGQHDHAEALLTLVESTGRPAGAVIVIRAQPEGLWALVWRYGWMALVALAALVAAWIWSASRRFGPALPDPEPRRRSVVEHVEAVGNYLWRRGHQDALLASTREAVRRRLVARLGGDTALEGEALAKLLEDETGMRASRVHDAFYGAAPRDRRAFVRSMRELQELWRAR